MNFYISRGGESLGPYALEQVKNMLAQNALLRVDLAWTEGQEGWQPLYQIPELASPSQSPPLRPVDVPTPPPSPSGNQGGRTWTKRVVGSLLTAFGIYGLFYSASQPFNYWLLVSYGWAGFLLIVGSRQLLGRSTDTRKMSLKASFSVIFGVLVLLPTPALIGLAVAARKDSAAGVVILPFALLAALAVTLGHRARRDINEQPVLKGKFRAAIGLFGGYACLAVFGFAAFNACQSIANPIGKTSHLKETAHVAAEEPNTTVQTTSDYRPELDALDADITDTIQNKLKYRNLRKLPCVPESFWGKRFVLAMQKTGEPVTTFRRDHSPIAIIIDAVSLKMNTDNHLFKRVYAAEQNGVNYAFAVQGSGVIVVLWLADDKLRQMFPDAGCTFQTLDEKSYKCVLSAGEAAKPE